MRYKKLFIIGFFSLVFISCAKNKAEEKIEPRVEEAHEDFKKDLDQEKIEKEDNELTREIRKNEEDEKILEDFRSKALDELAELEFLDGKSLIAFSQALFSKKDPKDLEDILARAKIANEEARREKEEIERPNLSYQKAIVKKIVDGDTIVVDLADKTYKLRMIGIDTPETKHPYKDVEFFGLEAYRFTEENLKNKEVYLEKDVSELDKYQRILRYVWIKLPKDPENPSYEEIRDQSFNGILLRDGFANASTYPPDVKYSEYFYKIEKEARESSRGLWDEGKRKAFEEENPKAEEESSSTTANGKWVQTTKEVRNGKRTYLADTTQGPVKANKKSGKYHVEGQQGYNKISIKNVEWFNSEKEAEAAGFVKAKR